METIDILKEKVKVGDCSSCGAPIWMPAKIAKQMNHQGKKFPSQCGDCIYKETEDPYNEMLSQASQAAAKSETDKVFSVSIKGEKMDPQEIESRIRVILRDRKEFPDADYIGQLVGLASRVSSERVAAVCRYLIKHPNQELIINDFARLLGVNI